MHAEYLWSDFCQSGVNLITGELGSGTNYNGESQDFLIDNMLIF